MVVLYQRLLFRCAFAPSARKARQFLGRYLYRSLLFQSSALTIAQVRSPFKATPQRMRDALGSVASGRQIVRRKRTHRRKHNVASQQRDLQHRIARERRCTARFSPARVGCLFAGTARACTEDTFAQHKWNLTTHARSQL